MRFGADGLVSPASTTMDQVATAPHRNVPQGDLVLITDKQLPRNEWSTGRVMDIIAGQDGLVRTAIVKTRAGTFSRPVVKLCVLEEVTFTQ